MTHVQVVGHVLRLACRADPRKAVAVLFMAALFAGATAAAAASQRWLFDSVASDAMTGVAAAVLLGIVAHVMTTTGGRVQGNFREDLTDFVDVQINEEILTASATIPDIAHLERPEYLDRLIRLRRGTRDVSGACWSLVETAAALVNMALMLSLLVTVHPILAITAALALPTFYFANRGRQVIQRAAEETSELERIETELHAMFTDTNAAKEVKVSGSAPWLNAHANQMWDQVLHRRIRAYATSSAMQLAGWGAYTLGFIGAIALVSHLVVEGRASVGDLVMVVTLASQLRNSVNQTVGGITRLGSSGHVIGHYGWLIGYARGQRPTGDTPPPERLSSGITLNAVRFAYPDTDRDVLVDVDVHLAAGHTVAVVGINGAGKTSLVKLLTGLYPTTAGAIEVDGVPLAELDAADWRARTTGTFQDFMKYQFLAREAVGVGHLPSIEDRGRVGRAVIEGGATTVVDGLTNGLETQLGKTFAGAELSHGQWQKLALARGNMRLDPLLIVLDEPTAALDPQAEHDLYERFITRTRSAAARSGSIALVVSHRFSTVRMADLIIVLADGRIIERGTHAQLIEANGEYAEHYRVQARGYRASLDGVSREASG